MTVYGWGIFQAGRAEREIKALERKCMAEEEAKHADEKKRSIEAKAPVKLDDLIQMVYHPCSAEELRQMVSGQELLTATQTEMLHLYEERIFGWYSEPSLAAGVVAISFAIPWLWYFALDRLRELSAAIQGK